MGALGPQGRAATCEGHSPDTGHPEMFHLEAAKPSVPPATLCSTLKNNYSPERASRPLCSGHTVRHELIQPFCLAPRVWRSEPVLYCTFSTQLTALQMVPCTV